tara:strand:- start:177 stop:1706 length:1530 start_codon:yes stop_codon:yes gene_type:complete
MNIVPTIADMEAERKDNKKSSDQLRIKQLKFEDQWQDPLDCEVAEDRILDVKVVDNKRTDTLTRAAIAISKQVQFPVNTAFMHGLGIIATAMTKSFSYEYYGNESPVNLYVVTSQPPSTGKSGINNFFVAPVRISFGDYNKSQQSKRNKIESKIKEIKTELKDAVKDPEIDALLSEMATQTEKLEETPIYRYSVSNTTPEALEQIAFTQTGFWNVISDEAGAINVLLGNMYSEGSLSNADIVLQSWDGDWLSSSRITRKAGEGYVRGSISVVAQDETISTILQAGSRGNGISERFLLLRENNKLGTRDHNKFEPVPSSLKVDYSMLINSLVFSDKTTFKFSDEAKDLIKLNKIKIEPHLSDGGIYSNNLLRGVVGKMDKQVMKMSCVLHVAEKWIGKDHPVVIEADTVKWAIKMYKELIKLYIDAADSNGFIGEVSELKAIKEQFIKFLQKDKQAITYSDLRDSIKSKSVFKGRARLAGYVKDKLMIRLLELKFCTIIDGKVIINPRLK